MAGVHHFFRNTLIVLMACAVVGIGAEELHRKTRKIRVSEASGQRMMKILNPDLDFKKGSIADKSRLDKEMSSERAQLKDEEGVSSSSSERLDPTGLRAIINKLLP
jgi:hypothetical protein